MLAYSYNNEGYFIGSFECRVDPLESELRKEEVFLIPANSTTIKPIEYNLETEKIRWNESQWFVEKIVIVDPIPPTPNELREKEYISNPLINWDNKTITVNEANQIYLAYFAENNSKSIEIQSLIISAKEYIRNLYPDN